MLNFGNGVDLLVVCWGGTILKKMPCLSGTKGPETILRPVYIIRTNSVDLSRCQKPPLFAYCSNAFMNGTETQQKGLAGIAEVEPSIFFLSIFPFRLFVLV